MRPSAADMDMPGMPSAAPTPDAGSGFGARQFGDDDDEHLGLMARSMGGSRTFTKQEVRQGYRRRR